MIYPSNKSCTIGPFTVVLLFVIATPAAGQVSEENLMKGPPILRDIKMIDIPAGDEELQKLLKQRYNEALSEASKRYNSYVLSGKPPVEQLVDSGHKLLAAGLELRRSGKEKEAFLREILEFANYVSQIESAREAVLKSGNKIGGHVANGFRLDVQIQLEKLKKAEKAGK